MQENERVLLYLDPQTRKLLVARLDEQLLEAHVASIIDKGFENLMAEKRVKDLERM